MSPWSATRLVLCSVLTLGASAHADKPERIPVALGRWTGPHAGSFKSALRGGTAKGCMVVRAERARVIVDGEVTGTDKPWKVRVIVKSPKTSDVVESREYTFYKPTASSAQGKKMGRDVCEMAQRAPE